MIALINRLNEEGSLKAEIEKVLNGLEEVIALINRLNEEGSLKAEIEKVLNGLEDYFALYNDEELEAELKQNQGVVKIIEWYIAFNKKLDRTPSALGQKIINEYNKYQK